MKSDLQESDLAQERLVLLRQAAELGPGYRGVRRQASREEFNTLAADFRKAGIPLPEHFAAPTEWVERRAKLFEAGDYPDKGVSVSAECLSALCASFDLPVPVLIEHSESPLELGYLTAVEACGSELFGTITLSREANSLVEKSGAYSLSLGLTPDLRAIREVSLVRNPRVASARLFSGPVFDCRFGESEWKIRFEELQEEVRRGDVRRQVEELIRAGKLTPAQAEYAEALLQCEDSVQFDGERKSLRQLFLAMLDRQPTNGLLSEVAPDPTKTDFSEQLMMPEEVEFYRRHFPDISLDAIAKRRAG